MRSEDRKCEGLETLNVEEMFKVEGGMDGTSTITPASPLAQLGQIIGELIYGKK